MADAATELARRLTEELTPAGSGVFDKLGGWLDAIIPQQQKPKPPPKGPLPRIVPDGKGGLIDLNTGKVVGRVSGASSDPLMGEVLANMQLEQAGSVMAPSKQPSAIRQMARGMGPTAGPALETGMDLLDMVLGQINPLDALSGGAAGQLAHVPQTYRKLGLARQGGALTPSDFATRLMEEGNYPRFKQLVERMVGKKLGSQFPVYRGFGLNDPLAGVAAGKELPAATAVTTKPSVARGFAHEAADNSGIPSVVGEMEMTPEGVMAILPNRTTDSFNTEAELLVDPRWAEAFNIDWMRPANIMDPGALHASDRLNTQSGLIKAAIEDALTKLRPARPIPGSGAHKMASTAPLPGIVETLKKALNEAAKKPSSKIPPMENLY